MNRWQDVLELDVQVAIYAGDAALWDQGQWNTHKWAGPQTGDGLMWTSIYERVTGLSISRGRPDLYEAATTGTCQIDITNDDGWANGRQTEAGMAPLVPARQVRIAVRPAGSYAADPYTALYTGFVDAVSAPWRTAKTAMATLRCVDALARLSIIDPIKTSVPREEHNDRLNRLFTMANWTGARDLAGAYVITRAGVVDKNILTEAQNTVYSANEYLFASRTGALTTRSMGGTGGLSILLSNADSFPAGLNVWCPNLPVDYPGASGEQIRNKISLSNVDGEPFTWNNTQSQTAYGIRTWARTELLGEDNTGLTPIGDALIAHNAWPRPGHLTYNLDLPSAIRFGDAMTLALADFGSWVRTDLTMQPVDGDPWEASTDDVSIIGVEHSITDQTWTVGITVDQEVSVKPGNLWTYSDYVRLDQPVAYWSLGEQPGPYIESSGVAPALNVPAFVGAAVPAVPGATGHNAALGPWATAVVTPTSPTDSRLWPAAMTVELWTRQTTGLTAFTPVIARTATTNGWWVSTIATGGVSLSAGIGGGTVTILNHPSAALFDGGWHHVVFVYSTAGAVLYIDAKQVRTGAYAGVIATAAIGMRLYAGPGHELDEVAVYNKVLTLDQITTHYKATGRTPAALTAEHRS